MNKVFNIADNNDSAVIEIYGEIGESWWDEGVTLKSVTEQLKTIGASNKKVLVKINSLGGDVNDALAIYDVLRSMGDRVTTECTGMCASAATIIAMAGSVRRMSRYALFLIHKCLSGAWGNENDIEEVLEMQRQVNDRLATLYSDVTGTDKAKIESLMNENNGDGTWLNVDQCKEYNFITEEIATEPISASVANYWRLLQKMFNKKEDRSMKKTITTLALLCAALAVKELDATKEGAILTDEQLGKINNKMQELLSDKDEAMNAKTAAETAKAEAEKSAKAAEEAKAKAEAKVQELQAIIDKMPSNPTNISGDDTKMNQSFEDWYVQTESCKQAREDLGIQ